MRSAQLEARSFLKRIKGNIMATHACCFMTATVLAFAFIPSLAGEIIYGPATPAEQPAWLANISAARVTMLASVNYSGAVYDRSDLAWTTRVFMAPQVMVHDTLFFDRAAGVYTVDKYLDDVTTRYGGVDAVLLWPTYPNIGIDARSQFDMLLDMPGGVDGLRRVVDQFHAKGVFVGAPYNPWDTGTQRANDTDAATLNRIWQSIGLDYFNGDTMSFIDEAFYKDGLASDHPLGIQPEGGPQLSSLEWSTMGWGYWDWSPFIPPVDQWKWLETRHVTTPCDRWALDKTNLIQFGFFNFEGWTTWESIWSIWVGIPPRDQESTRRAASILRFFAPFGLSTLWEPHYVLEPGAASAGVFASAWPVAAGAVYAHNATVWTIVHRGHPDYTGPVLPVPCAPGSNIHYWDLYRGVALVPEGGPAGGCALTLWLEQYVGLGGILQIDATDENADLADFLATMRNMTVLPLGHWSKQAVILQQTLVPIEPTPRVAAPPPGMVMAPGAPAYRFVVAGIEIEGGNTPGVDFQ